MIFTKLHLKKNLFSSVLLISYIGFAQSASITGTIIDKTLQQPISYATVILKSGNKTIKGEITNEKGKFLINKLSKGNYVIEVQFIGYKRVEKPIEIITPSQKVKLNSIFIEEDTQALDEVEITAERSTIKQKIDRKVIDVGKDLTTTGASASDIMGNIPSVSINQDGEISLRGNENVRILVDGKLTNISSSDLLQQIPSISIKTIELITNPSAKYNPEGMSGIINIILKKNTNLGFNGTISTGVTFAQKTRFNNSLNLNFRGGKTNIYGSYGNRLGEQITNGTITRTVENTNQLTKNINERTSHIVKLGLDYFINDKNTLSLYTNQNFFEGNFEGSKAITFYDNLNKNFTQLDNLNNDNTNATYNIDFKHDFEKEGQNIEFEVNYNTLKREQNNDFIFEGNSPLNNYSDIVDNKRINTTINIDYVHPIQDNSKIELGVETRFRTTDNTFDTSRIDLNDAVFSYDRNIYSFYTTFSQNFSKWKYNIGVRLEDYNVKANFNEFSKLQKDFIDKLFNVFPSGFVQYTLNQDTKSTYQLSFSRRIDRPSLSQVSPIRRLSTPQIVSIGNQSLRPQFTNSIELNYSRKIKNGNISFGGFYRKVEDEINRIGYFDTNDSTVFVLDYANFDSNDAYGIEFSLTYKPIQWWNINTSFDIYTRKQKGIIESESVEVSNTLMNVKMSNSFKISKSLTFQMFTVYRGAQKVLQYELKDNFYMNAGARYSFANRKGSVSLNFNDIFKTQRFSFEAFRTIKQVGEFKRDTQSVYLGLSYRFGGGKSKRAKRKKRDKNEKADRFL